MDEERVGVHNDTIEILSTISQGRMFSVLKARQGTKFVTLKVANEPDVMYAELLRREYELGYTLSHSCVVTTLGFEEHTEAGAAIVMEYIEGKALQEFLAQNPSTSARERVLNDILDGVEYLHHRGLLHNDLKPQNIIVNNHGAARIIDFGLSVSDDSLWGGCVGGSDGFLAPEIANGAGRREATSDIYSIGRLIEYIFEGGRYARIVKRATDNEPQNRYSSIAELRCAIVARRRLPWVVAGVVVVLSIAIAVVMPYINTTYEDIRKDDYRDKAADVLNQYYNSAMQEVESNRYTEFAVMARGEYMLRFQTYRDSLSGEQRLVAEEVFVEHIHLFDSLVLSLPSIYTLPATKCDSMILRLEEWATKLK